MGSPIASSLVLAVSFPSGSAPSAELNKRADPVMISVAPIRYDIKSEQKLGPKRAGLICLPNGSLSFRDLRLPPPETTTKTVSDRLIVGGLKVAPLDPTGFADQPTPYRMVATVVNIGLSVCAKRWGLGDTTSVTGSANVTIQWSIYGRQKPEPVITLSSRGSYATGRDSLDIGELVANAITDGAAQIAQLPHVRELGQPQ